MDLLVAISFLCSAAYAALGLLLAIHSGRRPVVRALVAACVTTALWSAALAGEAAGRASLEMAAGPLLALRSCAWIGFLTLACLAALPEPQRPRLATPWPIAAGALALGFVALELWAAPLARSEGPALTAGVSGRLLLSVVGLFLIELLLRRAHGDTRWRLRYLWIGLGGLLLFDFFLASEALLFRRLDPVLEASRGAAALLAVPTVAIAAARNPDWSARLALGRQAVSHSVVLFGIGIYLLALSGAGALLRGSGGNWFRILEAALLITGLLGLALLVTSPTVRRIWQRRLIRYLFTYRQDYRENWHRFAEAMSAPIGAAPLRERALQAVAEIVGSPSGALWIREAEVLARVVAGPGLPVASGELAVDDRFVRELDARRDLVLDLGEPGDPSSLRYQPWVPAWLQSWRNAWVVVPLEHRDALLGFLVLTRPPAAGRLDAEDEELLETLSRQVASYLAEERQTRVLEETRRFGEFSRNAAFIAHDLRNLANELSLTLSNARRHIRNPDFQQDLLLSMEESVARMQRLLDRLKSDSAQREPPGPVDLSRLIGDSLRRRFAGESRVVLELCPEALRVAGQPDRLVALTGHLIRNALDAVGEEGQVRVGLRREGDVALFQVEDDGPGMQPEQLRERMHHPFVSTKPRGFGIGLYECRELARELGGRLSMDSIPGVGSRARVWLPLAAAEPDPAPKAVESASDVEP